LIAVQLVPISNIFAQNSPGRAVSEHSSVKSAGMPKFN